MNTSHYSNMSSDELWTKAVDNELAFKHLFEQEFQRLFAYGIKIQQNKSDVKDAIQDVFTDLWTNRKQRLDIKNIHAYLLQSVRYRLIKKANNVKVIDIDRYAAGFSNSITEQSLDQKKALQRILLSMPKRQREVLHLKFYQGLTNPEIGQLLDMNDQSVANTLQRAYKSFRKNKSKKNISK